MPHSELKAASSLAAGLDWYLSSGIQEESGGVARYHHTDDARNARISTEITGYAVSSLLDLYQRTGEVAAMRSALHAGHFLCTAWDRETDAMPFEWSAGGDLPEHHSYFFDNGIVTRALIRLYRVSGEQKFLLTALRCGESMLRDFVNGTDIDPILTLPGKQPIARDQRWSRQSDCYQLKSALAWLELSVETGDPKFEAEYDRTLARALVSHTAFLDKEPGVRVMDRLHAYSYFLEAMLPRAGVPEVREALATGIARAAWELRRIRAEFERSDVPAQILRVRLWADQIGVVPLDECAARDEAVWVTSHQYESGGKNVLGGFCFGVRNGERTPYANPVSTAFCLQALALWDDHKRGNALADWRSLV